MKFTDLDATEAKQETIRIDFDGFDLKLGKKTVSLKEIKLRPGTETHDYNFKMKATEKFLVKGDKVKFTIKFKGREMQHLKLAQDLADRIVSDLKITGKVEQAPKMEGKQMTFIIQPLK